MVACGPRYLEAIWTLGQPTFASFFVLISSFFTQTKCWFQGVSKVVNLICSHRRCSFHWHLRFLVVGKLIHFKMVWYCALRRLSSFVVLMCILVATFFIIFSPFHGLKILLFKSGTISGKMVQEKKLLTFGIKSDDDSNRMMALHKPFLPDLNPTPRRSRRGTPDNTFGIIYFILFQILYCCLCF